MSMPFNTVPKVLWSGRLGSATFSVGQGAFPRNGEVTFVQARDHGLSKTNKHHASEITLAPPDYERAELCRKAWVVGVETSTSALPHFVHLEGDDVVADAFATTFIVAGAFQIILR